MKFSRLGLHAYSRKKNKKRQINISMLVEHHLKALYIVPRSLSTHNNEHDWYLFYHTTSTDEHIDT